MRILVKQGKQLRSDVICVVGFLVWGVFVYGIYLAMRDSESEINPQEVPFEKIEFTEPTSSE